MSYHPDNPFAPREETPPTTTSAGPTIVEMWPPTYLDRPDMAEVVDDLETGLFREDLADDLATAFTGPGTPNGRGATYQRGLFPPNWPAWTAFSSAVAQVKTLAGRVAAEVETVDLAWTSPRTGEPATMRTSQPDHPLVTAWMAAVDAAWSAYRAAKEEADRAQGYRDPDTGLDWLTLLRHRQDRDRLAQAAQAANRWTDDAATLDRPAPSLDDFTGQDWVIDGLLPTAGTALVVGAGRSGKTALVAHLAASVADGRPFLDRYEVAAESVVVIDTDSPPAVLRQTYAEALEAGATVFPFRARMKELDVTNPVTRTWLAGLIPAGAIVILDSLPALLAALGISETASEAAMVLGGLAALVVESGAGGLVVVHASPGSDPTRARGHGAISSWPSSTWAVKAGRRRTLTVIGAGHDEVVDVPTADHDDDDDDDVQADVQDGPTRMLAAVTGEPGKSTRYYGRLLGVSAPTATKYMAALAEDQKVVKVSAGQSHLWSPA